MSLTDSSNFFFQALASMDTVTLLAGFLSRG
jgi:hypothetical protein